MVCLRDQTLNILSILLIFLSSLDIRQWQTFKKDWTKHSREWTKKIVWSLRKYNFFGPTKKMRNWLDNWSANETDQNHIDVPLIRWCTRCISIGSKILRLRCILCTQNYFDWSVPPIRPLWLVIVKQLYSCRYIPLNPGYEV